jgi:DNA-binding NarL/FixJ family response regulator
VTLSVDVKAGMTSADIATAIAEKLCISKGTAHTHATHVYQKLDVHRQQELIELIEREKTKNVSPVQIGD